MKFKNTFWSVIAIFAFLYILLVFFAFYKKNSQNIIKNHETNQTITEGFFKKNYRYIIKEIDDNSILFSLENNQTIKLIKEDLNQTLKNLEKTIDIKVDKIFEITYTNIDSFLDFHYSIKGEYSELFLAGIGDIEDEIEKRLFKPEFIKDIQKMQNEIGLEFIKESQNHTNYIEKSITKNVDIELNSNILEKIKLDINSNIEIQEIKIGALIGVKIVPLIAKVISAKIALKVTSKIAIKTSLKGATMTTAIASGAICGPAVVICSSVLATVAWFGTDALLIAGDEQMNREDFKNEIVRAIDIQKKILKKKYKDIYLTKLKTISIDVQKEYQKLKVKKETRVRILDKISLIH